MYLNCHHQRVLQKFIERPHHIKIVTACTLVAPQYIDRLFITVPNYFFMISYISIFAVNRVRQTVEPTDLPQLPLPPIKYGGL